MADGHNDNDAKAHSKKKKKRHRGAQKNFRVIHVVQTGETAREKYLGGGRFRKLDVLKKSKEDVLPRKTRDMLRRMAAVNGGGGVKKKEWKMKIHENDEGKEEIGWLNTSRGLEEKKKKKEKVFQGMQQGESYAEFMKRLAMQRKQLSMDTARDQSHQRAKKKAHYKKRAMGKERRKRRNRGELSSDDEDANANANNNHNDRRKMIGINSDDGDGEDGMSHLPTYWQEVMRNHGRPVSEKRRKRMERADKAAEAKVTFGEHVQAPPVLTSLPKQRGRIQHDDDARKNINAPVGSLH